MVPNGHLLLSSSGPETLSSIKYRIYSLHADSDCTLKSQLKPLKIVAGELMSMMAKVGGQDVSDFQSHPHTFISLGFMAEKQTNPASCFVLDELRLDGLEEGG